MGNGWLLGGGGSLCLAPILFANDQSLSDNRHTGIGHSPSQHLTTCVSPLSLAISTGTSWCH